MTEKSATHSITDETQSFIHDFKTEYKLEYFESRADAKGREIIKELIIELLAEIDLLIQKQVPKDWKNVGTDSRKALFSFGYISFRRRIYRDGNNKRIVPLDLILGLKKYARVSNDMFNHLCVLAYECGSLRQASRSLECELHECVAPSTFCHKVKQFGLLSKQQDDGYYSDGVTAGSVKGTFLYGEADGLWIHLQRELLKHAEVKLVTLYSGKEVLGGQKSTRNAGEHPRKQCVHKTFITQIGGSMEELSRKVAMLAHKNYDVESNQCLITSGDGANWIKDVFKYIPLPQEHQLDRFHLIRTLKQTWGRDEDIDMQLLIRKVTSEGYEAVASLLQEDLKNSRGKEWKTKNDAIKYLKNNEEDLIDVRLRGDSLKESQTLGTAEGTVDKRIRQRLRGRGMSWSISGAEGMMAIACHLEQLKQPGFSLEAAQPVEIQTVRQAKEGKGYEPASGILSAWAADSQSSQQMINSLKRKLGMELLLSTT